MRRLSRCVHDQLDVRSVFRKQLLNRVVVTDIAVNVNVPVAQLFNQCIALPLSRCLSAEEFASHIVVNSNDGQALSCEVPSRLGSDQPG